MDLAHRRYLLGSQKDYADLNCPEVVRVPPSPHPCLHRCRWRVLPSRWRRPVALWLEDV